MATNAQTILLVDDELDILEFLSYNLKKEGYSIFTAASGEEAIAIARKEMPQLVLLDVMIAALRASRLSEGCFIMSDCQLPIAD